MGQSQREISKFGAWDIALGWLPMLVLEKTKNTEVFIDIESNLKLHNDKSIKQIKEGILYGLVGC